jgi:hypothetical protein
MTMTHVFLGVAVFSTGLFTGLLMTVKFFFERALRDLSGLEFALVMQRFLKITRTHPLNYAMVLVSGLAPVAVLVMLRESAGSLAFVLTAVGLLAFWCGSILPSTFFAQPLYGMEACSSPACCTAPSTSLRASSLAGWTPPRSTGCWLPYTVRRR